MKIANCKLWCDGRDRVRWSFYCAQWIKYLQRSEAAVATVVFLERGEELWFAKIGPESLRHDEFGVRNLPKEKVTDPHFAAGADEQIGIGNVVGVQVLCEDLFSDVSGIELAGFHFGSDAANG